MDKKISLIEDLAPLFPTTTLKIELDNHKTEKDVVVISETLGFQRSNELDKKERETRYTADISVYLVKSYEKVDFNKIYNLLIEFYKRCEGLESQEVGNKSIFKVQRYGAFGYVGKDKKGNYGFILNMKVDYYIN